MPGGQQTGARADFVKARGLDIGGAPGGVPNADLIQRAAPDVVPVGVGRAQGGAVGVIGDAARVILTRDLLAIGEQPQRRPVIGARHMRPDAQTRGGGGGDGRPPGLEPQFSVARHQQRVARAGRALADDLVLAGRGEIAQEPSLDGQRSGGEPGAGRHAGVDRGGAEGRRAAGSRVHQRRSRRRVRVLGQQSGIADRARGRAVQRRGAGRAQIEQAEPIQSRRAIGAGDRQAVRARAQTDPLVATDGGPVRAIEPPVGHQIALIAAQRPAQIAPRAQAVEQHLGGLGEGEVVFVHMPWRRQVPGHGLAQYERRLGRGDRQDGEAVAVNAGLVDLALDHHGIGAVARQFGRAGVLTQAGGAEHHRSLRSHHPPCGRLGLQRVTVEKQRVARLGVEAVKIGFIARREPPVRPLPRGDGCGVGEIEQMEIVGPRGGPASRDAEDIIAGHEAERGMAADAGRVRTGE